MLVITAILSRFASTDSFGAFGFALALLTPILLLFNLNLRTLILTGTEANHAAQNDYFVLTVLLTVGFVLVSIVVGFLNEGETRLMIIGASVLKGVEMLTSISTASNYKRSRTDLVAVCQVVRTLVVVLAFALGFFVTKTVWIGLLIAGFASLILFILFDWTLTTLRGNVLRSSFTYQSLRSLNINFTSVGLVAAVPVINAMLQNTPRYILNDMGELGGVAVITVLMYAAMPGNLILTSLASVLTPRLNAFWNSAAHDKFARESFVGLCGAIVLGLCVLLSGWFLGEIVVTAIFTERYSGYQFELRLMLSAAIVWYACTMMNVAVVAGRGYAISLVTSTLGIVTVIAAYLWADQGEAEDICWVLILYIAGMLVRFLGLLTGYLWLLRQRPLVREPESLFVENSTKKTA